MTKLRYIIFLIIGTILALLVFCIVFPILATIWLISKVKKTVNFKNKTT